MNQKKWVELFQELNGRPPELAEFSEALKNGEFQIESLQPEPTGVEASQQENTFENSQIQPQSVNNQKDLPLNVGNYNGGCMTLITYIVIGLAILIVACILVMYIMINL